ncbi:tRNA pseudouridine synthase D [Chloropicon primus]|uniref:tRNA pseudouridine synthase D n=2 Tax=Chloropicon primus TaxID=1764295 RepID=A0A5B8MJU2_9CHLO|nr:tRNA pseudouridine synthase D [Chloropicon primus]UPQ99562.1 tRNA pseudouridine synthase D [Chloropicon primus]|eukprot:QDZ20354.1 tRNA pseudouridine synthase D [Chloropicon primus]
MVTTREREEQVGIRLFRSEGPGDGGEVGGIFKHRYTDFVVREVDLKGTVAELNKLVASERPQKQQQDEQEGDKVEVKKSWEEDVDAWKELDGLVGMVEGKRVKEYVQSCAKKEEGGATLVLEPQAEKDKRASVHRFFKSKQHLSPQMSTDTLVEGDKKSVRVFSLSGSNKDHRKRKRGGGVDKRSLRELGQGKVPKFCRFLLYKENTDTQYAIHMLAKHLRINPKRLSYAGTKDKRGVTVQWCMGFKISARDLEYYNRRKGRGDHNVYVGNIEELDDGKSLGLGDLKGNHFVVILRGVEEKAKAIAEASVESLREKGFINYYGLQRFGTGGAPTHAVGIELMKGNWKQACKLILLGRDSELQRIKDARQDVIDVIQQEMNTESEPVRRKLQDALRTLPKNAFAEKCIVSGLLSRDRRNLVAALSTIPRTLKLMYIHAYQSYLWNSAASKRLEDFSGDHAVEGDLVFEDLRQHAQGMTYAKAESGEAVGGNNQSKDSNGADAEAALPAARHVTKEEEDNKVIGIDKVILPLPGSQTKYPTNAISKVYEDLLAEDGINLKKRAHKVYEFSSESIAGAYRSLINVPTDVSVDFLKYDDPDEQLVQTDLQKIKKVEIPRKQEGARNALKLEFTLGSSCYASMVVREICKGSVEGMS